MHTFVCNIAMSRTMNATKSYLNETRITVLNVNVPRWAFFALATGCMAFLVGVQLNVMQAHAETIGTRPQEDEPMAMLTVTQLPESVNNASAFIHYFVETRYSGNLDYAAQDSTYSTGTFSNLTISPMSDTSHKMNVVDFDVTYPNGLTGNNLLIMGFSVVEGQGFGYVIYNADQVIDH
jgi:hypothetical protein